MKSKFTTSIAQVQINFFSSVERQEETGCRFWRRSTPYADGSIGLVGTLVDGINLNMQFEDGVADMAADLVGLRVNLRLTRDCFELVNSAAWDVVGAGIMLEVELECDVKYGKITVNGEEQMSYTLYVFEVCDVEAFRVQKVGTVGRKEEILAAMRADKAKAQADRETARANRSGTRRAARAGAEETVKEVVKADDEISIG